MKKNTVVTPPLKKPGLDLVYKNFRPVSKCQIVRESCNASCRLDPGPTWLVKSCLDVLAPSITEMVNVSLLSGRVPEN